ncbi:hypothetical protein HYH03_016288 [Edaphochlamys debaryana]|uniref:Intraflagellar transport protein 57 n=1 Tax=Edaphochlamys debaryana TaxID=47281 RepID=A0A836BQD6_9CHLO|nr:hypothetical protein HYH03_016288 [Edaphochlamys debaryana]|eukprot:KAG2484902.1 hypothetical protein HYH03_016288 [Edaphochlamys debaryana]
MSSSKRGGRSSVAKPEEGVHSEPHDAPPAAPAGDAPPPKEKAEKPSKGGPVAVGRSLEIQSTPDVCMEMLTDKLKLLNYEADFCRKKKPFRKPLSRLYFAVPMANSSEQFFYFTSLATWLLSLAGVELPSPKEFDDPNITCQNLLGAIKKLGFAPPSYHPTKLTVGHGKEVVGVIDALVDYVLEKKHHSYKRPTYTNDGQPEEGVQMDDEAESAAMEGADELAMPDRNANDDDEEEEGVYVEPGRGDVLAAGAAPVTQVDADKAVLVSKVDPIAWKVELERVAPKLRITIAADSKDWRSHLDEAHQHKDVIAKAWPDSKQSLERLRTDLNGTLEKLQTREKYLNEQFETLLQQYRAARTTLTDVQETYNRKTEAVADRNQELHRIAEQLDEVKALMDEKGSNIADATPVARIKTAIKQLGKELHDMEVRIGVVSHTLLQLSLRNKRLMQAQAALSDEEED